MFNAESVSYRGDGHVVVRIAPSNSEDAAALQLLRPDRFRRRDEIGFAYQDDGGNMRVDTIESESLQGRTTFTVELSRAESNRGTYIHEMAVNNYTPDEVAEVRAHLLLLGKLPSDVPRRDLDFLRTFLGIDLAVDNGALLPRLVRELKLPPSELLPRARLVAVHTLKNTRTVEHVLELALGPMGQKSISVRFRGRRHQHYTNREPAILEVRGQCIISSSQGVGTETL